MAGDPGTLAFFSVGWHEMLLIALCLFISRVFAALVDAHQDEGMPLFPGGSYVLGGLCGLALYFASASNPTVQAMEVGVVLYWLWKGKIDCHGHVLGVLGIIASLLLPLSDNLPRGIDIFSIFLAYVLLDLLKHHAPQTGWIRRFFNWHLHFHLIGIGYALYCGDALAYATVLFTLAGSYLVYVWLGRKVGAGGRTPMPARRSAHTASL